MNTSTLVQKVWNFCTPLRDDGVGYGDYLEQLDLPAVPRWRTNMRKSPTTVTPTFPGVMTGPA